MRDGSRVTRDEGLGHESVLTRLSARTKGVIGLDRGGALVGVAGLPAIRSYPWTGFPPARD